MGQTGKNVKEAGWDRERTYEKKWVQLKSKLGQNPPGAPSVFITREWSHPHHEAKRASFWTPLHSVISYRLPQGNIFFFQAFLGKAATISQRQFSTEGWIQWYAGTSSLAHRSQWLYASYFNAAFDSLKWAWWEYLHHRNQPKLQFRNFFLPFENWLLPVTSTVTNTGCIL